MSEAYYHTDESVEEYIRLAQGYNGKELISKMHAYLNSGAEILEIGSGPGSDWEILNSKYSVTGSDNSKQFIEYLISTYPEGDFHLLDATTLVIDKNFDCIYSNKVMHHLNDTELELSIKRQYDILETDGLVCHSFWKGEGTEVFKGLFVNYHTTDTLRKFFEVYFDILLVESYKEFEDDDSLFIICKKKHIRS